MELVYQFFDVNALIDMPPFGCPHSIHKYLLPNCE